jgi:thiol-disulfide isomerase/thioredoxin
MKRSLLSLIGLLAVVTAIAAPPSSSSLLGAATKQAKQGNKQVMVIFHASWCGWCKKLDEFMARPDVKPIFDKYVVVTHLDVLEQPAQKGLENDGAEALLEQVGAKEAGIPFTLMYDTSGTQMADSFYVDKGNKTNIGYPAEPQEIVAYMTMLKKSIPNLSTADADLLQQKLTEAAKAIKH